MIKINELRIGNWFLFSGVIAPVCSIDAEDNNWVRGKKKFEGGTSYLSSPLKNIYGIVLTPEILKKAGFVWEKDIFRWVNHKTKFEIIKDDYGFQNGISRVVTQPKLEYLHQLQNLYYCLTGEELKIQL